MRGWLCSIDRPGVVMTYVGLGTQALCVFRYEVCFEHMQDVVVRFVGSFPPILSRAPVTANLTLPATSLLPVCLVYLSPKKPVGANKVLLFEEAAQRISDNQYS